MPTTATAPVYEIGYTQSASYNWWQFEEETTPELVWPNSIIVYDAMRRTDSQVASVLRAVTLPVRRTPWRIDPAGARPEVVQLVADDLGLPIVGQKPKPPPRTKDRFSWPEHLRLALLMLPMGHAYFEQVYRVDETGTRAHLRKLAYRPSKTIESIDVAPDGGLISITQWWTKTGSQPRPIPVDRLVAYIHDREGGNWLGSSLLRPAYKHWLIKDRLLRVQAQTIERNGMGIPVYEAEQNATEEAMDKGAAMAQAWRSGQSAGSATPFGAKIRLVGVEGTLPDADPAIRYHDEQIARAVLAHFLNLGTQTGSWALGTTFADFFTLSLQTLAQQIADTATQHIIEDLVDVNFGESEPAPKLVFDEIGSRQAATAQALKLLVDAGLITPDGVLDETLRQQYGLPVADPATAATPAAAKEPVGEAPDPEPVPGEGSVAASARVDDTREVPTPPGTDEPQALASEPVTAHYPGIHDQKSHGRWAATRRAKKLQQEVSELRDAVERAAENAKAKGTGTRRPGSGGAPTDTPTRMTREQYTELLKTENVRLQILRGKSEKDARAAVEAESDIDELKDRNASLRRRLLAAGIDHRTDEQKKADDVEKNKLLDDVERLASELGLDAPAKRVAAAKMTVRELRKFVADAREYRQRQAAKAEAESGGPAAVAAWAEREAQSLASPRQVGYIIGLLRRRNSDVDGPTSREDVKKLSKAEASAYISLLERGS